MPAPARARRHDRQREHELMARPLSAAHFKQQQRVPIATMPKAVKLAALLALSFTKTLAQMAPVSWKVSLDRIEEASLLPAEAYVRSIRLESGTGSLPVDLAIDRPAITGLIEALMGGGGVEPPFELGERPISKIETAALDLFRSRFAEEMAAAFASEYARPFSHFLNEAAAGGPPITEERAVFRFILNVFGHSGELRLSMPRRELLEQVKGPETASEDSGSAMARQKLQQQVGRSDVQITVSLAPERLLVADVTSLRPGRMIELSSSATSPVTIWSSNVAAFEGRLMRAGDRLAVSITAAIT
jgi:flagellar motor switch protein FliM